MGYLDLHLNLTVVFLLFYDGIIIFKVEWRISILNYRNLLEGGWIKDYSSDNKLRLKESLKRSGSTNPFNHVLTLCDIL